MNGKKIEISKEQIETILSALKELKETCDQMAYEIGTYTTDSYRGIPTPSWYDADLAKAKLLAFYRLPITRVLTGLKELPEILEEGKKEND